MNIFLTQEQLESILTEKGKEAVANDYNLAICIHLTPKKIGTVAFDESYAFKLHNRKLANYLQTLYQINGQVNTGLLKMVHNYAAVHELIELGYINGDILTELMPKLVDKMALLEQKSIRMYLNGFVDTKQFGHFYVIHYKGDVLIINKRDFKKVVTTVDSGHWEGGAPKEQIKALRAKKVKRDWTTKLLAANPESGWLKDRIILVEKNGNDACTIFPSSNFNHKKFVEMHREMSYNEVKLLVENKFHREKDVEWFKQFETEVK